MTPSGTRIPARELRSWHLLVALAVVLAVDVAVAWSAW